MRKWICFWIFSFVIAAGIITYFAKNNTDTVEQAAVNATYYPEGSDKVLVNPYMGLAPIASAKSVYQPFSLVYAGVSWKDLEPEKGKYNFEEFEKKYRYEHWKQNGVKFIIRFFMDYPSQEQHMDIPEWLYQEIGGEGIWYDQDGKKGFSPEYRNEILIENHRRLIRALGERYNNDTTVAFVELGSIGHWGEWHVTYIEKEKKAFPEVYISDGYVEAYVEYLNNKVLVMRRPYKIAKEKSIGLYNDSFGNVKQTEDYFLKWINEGYKDHYTGESHPAMPDFWKTAPSGGEFSNYPGEFWIDNENFERTLSMLKNSHTSWLGPSSPAYSELSEEKQQNMNELLKTMGYRFRIKKSEYSEHVEVGQRLIGTIEILNDGIAPFYFDWPICIAIYNSNNLEVSRTKLNFGIRGILPGEAHIPFSIPVESDITAGIYNMKVLIIDPETGKPAIEFANVSEDGEKAYFIGSFEVKK